MRHKAKDIAMCVFVGGGSTSSSHRVGEGGGVFGLGCAQHNRHEQIDPGPLACGHLITMCVCGETSSSRWMGGGGVIYITQVMNRIITIIGRLGWVICSSWPDLVR